MTESFWLVIAGGLVGGLVGLASSVVPLLLQRRWQSEDRRRVRAEESAQEILDEVTKVARLCHDHVRTNAYRADAWPPQDAIRPSFDAIYRAATRVPDDRVKRAAELAAALLFYSSPSDMAMTTWRLIGVIEKEMRAVVGAYLTGRPVPPTPGMVAANVALEEYHGWISEQIRDDEEAEAAATSTGGE